MTYAHEMREFLTAIGHEATIYDREPARESSPVSPLTRRERKRVDELSRERGYRRFTAERMTAW